MRVNLRLALLPTFAFAGLLLGAAPAQAFWPKATYRERVVVRSHGYPGFVGWPGWVGAPGFGLTGGTSGQAFYWGTSPVFSQGFLFGGGTLTTDHAELIRREVDRQMTERAQRGEREPGSGGTPTPSGTACAEVAKRLTDIEGRLSKLSDKVATIEAKVDKLLKDKERQQMVEMIVAAVDARVGQIQRSQNADLAALFRELLKAKPEDRDMKKIEQLLKKLEGP